MNLPCSPMRAGLAPRVLFARNMMPARDLKELIAWLKANSNKASAGFNVGSSQILAAFFYLIGLLFCLPHAVSRTRSPVLPRAEPGVRPSVFSMRGFSLQRPHAPRLPTLGLPFPRAGVGSGTKQMKTRVIIEYDLLPSDRVVVRDRAEQRWTACKTVLALSSQGYR
jgi:hypothetical protein